MFIPTAIVVYDNNQELSNLSHELSRLIRVVHRTSLQGEQLYSFSVDTLPLVEGIIYYDNTGTKKMVRRDHYTDALEFIKRDLATLSTSQLELINEYLSKYKFRENKD